MMISMAHPRYRKAPWSDQRRGAAARAARARHDAIEAAVTTEFVDEVGRMVQESATPVTISGLVVLLRARGRVIKGVSPSLAVERALMLARKRGLVVLEKGRSRWSKGPVLATGLPDVEIIRTALVAYEGKLVRQLERKRWEIGRARAMQAAAKAYDRAHPMPPCTVIEVEP